MSRVGAILILGFIAAHTGGMPDYLAVGFIIATVLAGIATSPFLLASMKRRLKTGVR